MIYMDHWQQFKAIFPLKVATPAPAPARGPFQFVFGLDSPENCQKHAHFRVFFRCSLGGICIILMRSQSREGGAKAFG